MHKNTAIPSQADIIPRTRLDELLAQAIRYPFVTVTAGPGYGKTTYLAHFLGGVTANVAWMRLTKLDNIPSRFWIYFVEAIRQNSEPLAFKLSQLGFPDSMVKFDIFVRLLAREIYDGEQWIIVLDEYEDIYERQIHRFIEDLVDINLENFCLILISRNEVDLNLLDMLDNHLLFRITERDLRLDENEIHSIMALYNLQEAQALAHEMWARAEGWPLPIFSFLADYKAGRTLADYRFFSPMSLAWSVFENEHFAVYERRIQVLLVRLSELHTFPADILPQIFPGAPGDAIAALDGNPFISFSPVNSFYSIHGLYNEFLQQRKNLVSPEELAETYSVAADWYMAQGQYFDAIACYEKCGRYDELLRAINSVPQHRLERGVANFILEYLEKFPDDFVRANPIVRFRKATTQRSHVAQDGSMSLLTDLRKELEEAEPTPESTALLGEIYLLLADFCIIQNTDCFQYHYQKAVEYLPEGSTQRGESLYLIENHYFFFLQHNVPGEVERLREIFFRIMPSATRAMNGCGHGAEYLFSAEAAFFTNDLPLAQKDAFRALYRAKEKRQYDIMGNARFLLMRTNLMMGNYEGCIQQLEELKALIRDNQIVDLYNLVDYAYGWFFERMGDLEEIPRWLTDESANRQKQRPMSMGRDSLILAGCYLQQKRYYELLALLEQLEGFYIRRGLWVSLLDTYILRAVCQMKYGDKQKAVRSLYRAYEISHQNGVIVPFIEHSNNMRTLIDIARRSGEYDFDPEWLDTIHQKSSTYAKRLSAVAASYYKAHKEESPDIVALTERETEVLHCLAQGLTRDEIGSYLKISVNTVKTIIKSIYKKMNAVNRSDAVHIATMMGIIS